MGNQTLRELDSAALQQAIDKTVAMHPVLRTRFEVVDGTPQQQIIDQAAVLLNRIDLGDTENLTQEEKIARTTHGSCT